MFCTSLVSAQDKICLENETYRANVNDFSLSMAEVYNSLWHSYFEQGDYEKV